MTARKRKQDGKLVELQLLVADMTGLDKAMADDLLWAYTRLWDDVQALDARLAADGLLIELERGGANNRHVELVKNPAFDMRHKATSQLADLAVKIRKFVTLSERDRDGEEGEDELASFIMGA